MKKLSLILALMLVLSCALFAACGGDEESSAADSSAASSEAASSDVESSEASSEAASSDVESSEVSDDSSVADDSSAADDSSSDESDPVQGDAATDLKGENVARGKNYTGGDPAVTDANGSTSNYTANLTDGAANNVGAYDNTWFALWYNPDASVASNNAPNGVGTIVIDLEKKVEDINAIRVNLYNANASGIVAAKSIVAYVSDDNSTWTELGALVLPTGNDPDWASIALDGAAGQYVKLEITVGGTWTFLNEIEVYAD